MLGSWIFQLRATNEVEPPILYGKQARGWFLEFVKKIRPDLFQILHGNQEDSILRRAYTISTLLGKNGLPLPLNEPILRGQPLLLRLSSYNDALTDVMVNEILPQLPSTIYLNALGCRLENNPLQSNGFEWEGVDSFAGLVRSSINVHRSRQVCLEFVSPTAIRTGKVDLPLPMPGAIFSGLWSRWNENAPKEFQVDDLWPDFAHDCLVIDENTQIVTCRWPGPESIPVNGFIGRVFFTMLPRNKVGKWESYWDGADQKLQALSSFAFFCGAGYEPMVGLGQVRKIPIGNKKYPNISRISRSN